MAATTVQKLTGKAGWFSLNGFKPSFSKWGGDVARELVDTTASDNYDPTTDLLHKSQLPVSIQLTVDVEGFFDLSSTDLQLVALAYSGAVAVPFALGLNAVVVFGHGFGDIKSFKCEAPVDGKVTFTCQLVTNGVFVHGA